MAQMGTILQDRLPQCLERISTKEREWRRASRNNNVPNGARSKMGRRQSQRKSLQPQNTSQDTGQTNEKRLQLRRKHNPYSPLSKCNITQLSFQGTSESKSHPAPPTGDKGQPKVRHKLQKQTALINTTHASAFPDPVEAPTPNQEAVSHGESDDSDVSESERIPVPSSGTGVPPQLDLRPEVICPQDDDDKVVAASSRSRRPKGQRHHSGFPDFLPPPFNSWSLSQLAVCCHSEGRGAPRPGPTGPLEKYLERLLRLEWNQIQTVREESGSSSASEVPAGCHRSHASPAFSSRLSSPKSILQCQRAFPLTFLSSLASHPALLSGCACALCLCLRCSTTSVACCRSAYGQIRHSRPFLERTGPASLPKRSYSETRVHPADSVLESRAQRFNSPVRGNSHLRRMQASGNIRNPVQGATKQPHPTARDSSVGAQSDRATAAGVRSGDYRSTGLRRRSGSERRKSETGRRRDGSEKRRGGSECRRGEAERRRAVKLQEKEIKPDAVTAIMDNLPGSKKSPQSMPNRPKQVEFVTE